MSDAHQQFSAKSRASGELDRPGKRRRSLETGRISVTLGTDLACIVEHEGKLIGLAAGAFIRKVMLEHYASQGQPLPALAARAAALRADREAAQTAAAGLDA